MWYGWFSGLGAGLLALAVGLIGLLAPIALVAVALGLAAWAFHWTPPEPARIRAEDRDHLDT
jgi:hypothetical protein